MDRFRPKAVWTARVLLVKLLGEVSMTVLRREDMLPRSAQASNYCRQVIWRSLTRVSIACVVVEVWPEGLFTPAQFK
jgi:hypothetical protein